MISVCVKCYANLPAMLSASVRQRLGGSVRAGQAIQMTLVVGASVSCLLDELGIPREHVRVAFVNNRAQRLDHQLADGDRVGLFPPIGGG